MNSEQLREKFLNALKEEFSEVRLRESGNNRISTYVPNKRNDKRWMQVDANPNHLSIAMDHSGGDIKIEDVKNLGLKYGLNRSCSAIQLYNDAVKISIFENDPYDFTNEKFIRFLRAHYQSYIKRVGKHEI